MNSPVSEVLPEAKSLVTWDPSNRKQVDEAKKKYLQAKKEDRAILSLVNQKLPKFDAELGAFKIGEVDIPEGFVAVRLINETGDERVIWNSKDPGQTKEAFERFQKYLDKGWKAYAINVNGSRGQRISKFDAMAEEIVFDDKGIKVRLKDFAAKFRKVEILPRTMPG